MKLLVYLICFLGLGGCVNQSASNIFLSLDDGLKEAQIENKKIVLIFDSRTMSYPSARQFIYDDKEVKSKLKNFIVILLYADAPGDEGAINKALQIEMFGKFVQPMYCIIDSTKKIIKQPIEYCKKSELIEYLDCSSSAHENKK